MQGRPEVPAGKALAAIAGLAVPFIVMGALLRPLASSVGPQIEAIDFSGAHLVEVRTLDGAVVMSGELRERVDSLGNVEKDAALLGTDADDVIGEVEIEVPRDDAPDQRQELEIDIISLEPSTTYRVYVNDRPVASFITDDRGSVDVEFVSMPPSAPSSPVS